MACALLSALLLYLPAFTVAGTVTTVDASSSVLSQAPEYFGYGLHQPQGLAAVRYLYGAEGTWKKYTGLQYIYNYYNTTDSEKSQLIQYANGNNPSTSPDANRIVLWNLARNSGSASGTSFEEHNGRGAGGASRGQPFSQFWFDDNFLARDLAQTYGAPQPAGLFVAGTRWSILRYDSTNWPDQSGNYPDQHALKGLYYLSQGKTSSAYDQWSAILNQAGSAFDSGLQRYSYSGLGDTYYLGLFKILSDRLMDAGVSGTQQALIFQHSISLRADILAAQQIENGTPIGWITSRSDNTSLINTETTSVLALGLGAGARYSYEAGVAPMQIGSGAYFYRDSQKLLAAVKGLSPAGTIAYGPYVNLPTGSYTIDFYLRSDNPGSLSVGLDVNDANQNEIIGTNSVTGNQFPRGYQWGRFSININVQNPQNSLEFRVTWGGQANLDVSAIRVR